MAKPAPRLLRSYPVAISARIEEAAGQEQEWQVKSVGFCIAEDEILVRVDRDHLLLDKISTGKDDEKA